MNDDGAPLVFETPGGPSVSYRGRLLYSGRDPASLPRRLAAACDSGPSRLLLAPSPLLWYGIPELLAALGKGSALLCVETDSLLAELARSHLPPELADDDRIAFVETSSPEVAVEAASRLGSFRFCSIAPLSGGYSLDTPIYTAMAAALTADFESSWRNRAALMLLGPRWARNIFDNIAALPTIAPAPLPLFPGAVVVCGAGPSLEEALPFIAGASLLGPPGPRRKLGVIACDTALGTLMAAGIEPDLVVCLEGQAHNLADFTCLGSRPAAVAADLSSHPLTFRALRGPKFLTFVRITRSRFLSRVEAALSEAELPFRALPPLGSVGVHAVHIARLLSRGPILAAGLDFSFEPGKTHARGCPSLLAEERRLGRLTRWPSQYEASFRDRTITLENRSGSGPNVLSDPILLSYAALLADRGKESGGELCDLRRDGPTIGGRRMTLSQAESVMAAQRAEVRSPPEAAAAAGAVSFDAVRSARVLGAFLREESRRLSALRLSMRGARPLEKGEFRRLASESDYLWWGFPDQDRAPKLPQDFLNRLVPQVEYWTYRIAALAASLKGS
jgi:hypothetical protein